MKPIFTFLILFIVSLSIAQIPAFPGAEGFGTTTTTGGRGGQVIYVTNLKCSGPGSLNAALATSGKKYILFKVSGIIDCAAEVVEGDCYIAGQTSPGGVIVRNLIFDSYYNPTRRPYNVIVRHLNSRPHTTNFRAASGWIDEDGLRLDGAKNVVIDHCSFANATDEAVQISRTNNVTIQNCMLAEPIGDHYQFSGMLLNYSVTNKRQDSISIHHNLWNRVGGRMPEISCEQSGETPNDNDCKLNPLRIELSNNLLWDIPIHVWFNSGFNQSNPEAPDYKIRANFVNNYAVGRTAYKGAMFHNHFLSLAQNQLYASGNKMQRFPNYTDYQIFYCCNDFADAGNNPNTNLGSAMRLTSRHAYPNITYTPTANLQSHIALNVGAFNRLSPQRRDPMTRRLLSPLTTNVLATQVIDGVDRFSDAFNLDFTNPPAPPLDSDNDGMPDTWETANGLNPALMDQNGTQLSVKLTGIVGYTNLECYLNQLSDNLVSGNFASPTQEVATRQLKVNVIQNAQFIDIQLLEPKKAVTQFVLTQSLGSIIQAGSFEGDSHQLTTNHLSAGIYYLKIEQYPNTVVKKILIAH